MFITTTRQRLHHFLWGRDIDDMPGWEAALVSFLRISGAVLRDLSNGLPTLRAMSLVYTTLLSLVPLIAVSFSVLKGFGVHNQIEPMLLQLLAPLGEKSTEITEQIIGFVNNMKVGVLGAVGLFMLLYTVLSLIKKIESAFNFTWRIRKVRSLSDSFTNYLSIIMVGPVLMFTALGISASVRNSDVVMAIGAIEPFGTVLQLISKIVPYLLIIAAFTFVYKLVPNTLVKIRSAFYGAVVAGVLWETTGRLFAVFVASSTNYTAIYSGFAILIMFMIWLYLSWLILLTGSSIAYYHQHPERITDRSQVLRLSCRLREKLSLLVMQTIAERFHRNESLMKTDHLARELDVSSEALSMILDALEQEKLVLRTGDSRDVYVPGRSLENILLSDILDAVRIAEESPALSPTQLCSNPAVDEVSTAIDDGIRQQLRERSLLDIVRPS